MKKKQVIVVKKIEQLSPKREIYISRKAQCFDSIDPSLKDSFVGNPAPQRPIRDINENILTRSILGETKVFESFVDLEDTPIRSSPSGKRNIKAEPSAPTFHSNKKKSVMIQPHLKMNPKIQPGLYLESLQKLKIKATKLREKEIEKETKLIQYLPVNERFDLNKEGKVLAMWQERQQKWDIIQKTLARRVGGSISSLMMNTGDEFRARNEEYDVLQAAIPVHERFGAESWKMMLRDGTERSVSVGHVFSGLSCPVSIKTTVPAIIRKPRRSGSFKKGNTFIDPTPSLLRKQKQLQKTLQTLRPHSLAPSDVDGFTVSCQNLFDWAIKSSEKYLSEEKNKMRSPSIKDIPSQEKIEFELPPIDIPQLTFLSSRNILFHALEGEIIHRVVIFKNTGPTAVSYQWKPVPERELHEPTDVAFSMSKRNDNPRAHILSKERSTFFCYHPTGQILPGDSVETVFGFCSKGSGGNFFETWVLDTLPRASVIHPPSYSKVNSLESTHQLIRAQPISVPSTVYVKLKGHAFTLDEHQHRRNIVTHAIHQGCKYGNMKSETYSIARRVRGPVTEKELFRRKLKLFKDRNATFLTSISPVFIDENNIKLTISRLEKFSNLNQSVLKFISDFRQILNTKLEQLRTFESYQLPGLSRSKCQFIELDSLPIFSSSLDLRGILFPEKDIEIFDEVTEQMISNGWDFDLNSLRESICQLIDSATKVQEIDLLISKNNRVIENFLILQQRKLQDSDYEEEDEEEELTLDVELYESESSLLQTAKSLFVQFEEMIFQLLIDPLPEYFTSLKNGLIASFTNIDVMRSNSLEVAGLKGDLLIATIPSPFTSVEGQELWQNILNPKQQIIGKKPPAPKSQKGFANEDQRRKYYLHMYESIYTSLIENIIEGLSGYDKSLASLYENNLCNMGYSNADQISTIRQEDIPDSSPIFLVFDGEAFLSPLQYSAFNTAATLKLDAVAPITNLIQSGIRTIVLLSEIRSSSEISMNGLIRELSTLLTQELLRRTPKNQSIQNFTLKYISSLAELNHYFDNLKKIPTQSNSNYVTILVVENLASPSLVPQSPPYREPVSDDEEDSIPLGVSESRRQKKELWESEKPHVLPVSLNLLGDSTIVDCYSDGATALTHLVSTTHGIWLEGSLRLLLPPLSGILENCLFSNTFVSDQIKSSILWFRVISLFPIVRTLRSMPTVPKSGLQNIQDYISFLFPAENISDPSFVLTLGGSITTEKFRFLERLLDLCNTVILAGEFSLPFLFATGVQFHRLNFAMYKTLCASLLTKARLRGVQVVLPLDLVVGDEPIENENRMKCFQSVDRDSRDEGADYDGESAVVSCVGIPTPPILGIPFDIGPVTCQQIRALISQHHLHISWGTVGCCEISSFQAGQRVLVECSARSSGPCFHNIVLGESNSEWWSRIADPEGEFEGNLILKGVADYVCRNSTTLTSLLSLIQIPHLQRALLRPTNHLEWNRLVNVKDEDVEDDEDDS